MTAKRQGAWPSVERDPLALNDRMHWAFPSGFYYKTLIKPKWAWPKVEPIIRQVAGRGRVNVKDVPRDLERAHRHPDVLVIGLGPAGLSAALGAAAAGKRVFAIDENEPGWKLPPGPVKEAVARLVAEARREPLIELAPSHTAVGIYEGLEVPVIGPDLLHMVHPGAIVVATGAFEQNIVFAGNEVPGVFLGRGAARLSAAHGIRVGDNAVVLGGTHEAPAHTAALRSQGTAIEAVVLPARRGRRGLRGRAHRARHGAGGPRAQGRERRHGRARRRRHRALHVRRPRALRRLHAAGEPAAPDLRRARLGMRRHRLPRAGRAGDRRRPQGRRRRGRRRAHRASRARDEDPGLRIRRLRLHLLRRHRRRDRALGEGGVPLDRAPEALHDGDDGRLPGTPLPRAAARAQRALLARRRRRT